jgi:hypothetical protein
MVGAFSGAVTEFLCAKESLSHFLRARFSLRLDPAEAGFSLHEQIKLHCSLPSSNGRLYYGRTAKALEDEVPVILGGSYTAYGKPFGGSLFGERVKRDSRVKAKLAHLACK